MSLARLVITAVTVERRSKSEVACDYGSLGSGCRSWCTAFNGRARLRSSLARGARTAIREPSIWMWKTRSSGSGKR